MSIEERMSCLEQHNRRDKRTMVALLLAIVAAFFVSAGESAKFVKAVKSESFVLVDANGAERGGIYFDEGVPVIELKNADGAKHFTVSLDTTDSASLTVRSKTHSIVLKADEDGTVAMFLDKGSPRVFIDANKKEAAIKMFDIAQKFRCILGADEKAGSAAQLRGEDGTIIWKAPPK